MRALRTHPASHRIIRSGSNGHRRAPADVIIGPRAHTAHATYLHDMSASQVTDPNMVSSSEFWSSIQKARATEVIKERAVKLLKDAEGAATGVVCCFRGPT